MMGLNNFKLSVKSSEGYKSKKLFVERSIRREENRMLDDGDGGFTDAEKAYAELCLMILAGASIPQLRYFIREQDELNNIILDTTIERAIWYEGGSGL